MLRHPVLNVQPNDPRVESQKRTHKEKLHKGKNNQDDQVNF